MPSLQQSICRQIEPEGSSADPFRCEEIPVQKLLQNFLQNVSSAQTWGIWLLCSTLSLAVNVYRDPMHFSTPVANDKWKPKGIFSSASQPPPLTPAHPQKVEELIMSVQISLSISAKLLKCEFWNMRGKEPCMTFQIDHKEEAWSAFFSDEAKCA